MMMSWENWTERFNRMSQRERVMVGGGVIGVTLYLGYFLLIDPLILQKPKLVQAIQQERAMSRTLDSALVPAAGRTEADAVKRAYQEALQKQLAEVKARMDTVQRGLVPPAQMAKLLEGVLGHNRGVELVSLRKLPVERVRAGAAAGGDASVPQAARSSASAAAATDAAIYRHGFELNISGSYGALYDYLVRLEKLPWRILWSKVSLDATEHPRLVMTLVVHTLSLDSTWLTL